ncbi:hypothetical protein OSB04_un000890 [Centaurea solstitialis]|uniref:Uncharacterized protein n=1 Tax=Centaurea solstitialis TaxID=347529 RepID=A0AA38S389_9ASTR|nr:hypothetical protein OSB04_un000890 [Centaurea solstitialis]
MEIWAPDKTSRRRSISAQRWWCGRRSSLKMVVAGEHAGEDGGHRKRRRSGVDRLVYHLHHYKVDVFYSVIDMQLQELNNRFNESNTTLLLSIASFWPRQSFKSFQVDELMKMAEFYPVEFLISSLKH